jgi:hypothetical protein
MPHLGQSTFGKTLGESWRLELRSHSLDAMGFEYLAARMACGKVGHDETALVLSEVFPHRGLTSLDGIVLAVAKAGTVLLRAPGVPSKLLHQSFDLCLPILVPLCFEDLLGNLVGP